MIQVHLEYRCTEAEMKEAQSLHLQHHVGGGSKWRAQAALFGILALALAGRLPWNTYKYYCENRWSFFVWQPQGSRWLMFPKRAFATSTDLEEFRGFLQRNLKPSRWFYL
jgi:hypothetical protein